MGQELALAQGDPDQVGPRVERPHEQDDEQDPTALPAELRRRRRRGNGRSRQAQPDQSGQQPNVYGTESGRHPGREADLRVLLREGRDPRGHDRRSDQ